MCQEQSIWIQITIYERVVDLVVSVMYLSNDNGNPDVDDLTEPSGPNKDQISMDKNVTFTFDYVQGRETYELFDAYTTY